VGRRVRLNVSYTKQLLSVIVLCGVFLTSLWGLDPVKQVKQYLVDRWEMAEGLPSNEIRSITQTPDGYLWIATARGLVRFDGIKFTTVPFVDKEKVGSQETIDPVTLLVDKQGILWIGSTGVLTSYNYRTGRFKTYTSADGMTGDRIRRLQKDMNGNLWISFFSSYANRFSEGKFTAFNASHGLLGKKIDVIFEDSKGNLLFGSRENGVFIYNEGKFSPYPIAGMENFPIITAMDEDWKENLWIGTNIGLFEVIDRRTEKYTVENGLSGNFITGIIEDSDRNLWVSTSTGLNRLKKKPDGTIVIENLLESLFTYCLFEDKEKNLWIGTLKSGIRRLQDRKFVSYTPLELYRDEDLLSVCEDSRGETWIGTFTGKLFHCRGNKIVECLEPPELSGTGITAIVEDVEGNLWLGTNGKGIFQKKKDIYIQFTTRQGLADNQVTSISRDSQNNLWFSTFDGLSVRYYPGAIIKSFTAQDGLLGKRVYNVYEDSKHRILVAADKGITLLTKVFAGAQGPAARGAGEGPSDHLVSRLIATHKLPHPLLRPHHSSFIIHHYTIPPWPPEAILKNIPAINIYEEPSLPGEKESTYWITTNGAGLKRVKSDGTVTSFTTSQGMTSDVLYRIFADQQGYFWITSNSGIIRISKSELDRFARGESDRINCISYGVSDGMKSSEFNNELSRHSAIQTRDGKLWFITKEGIAIVNPGKIHVNKTPPLVVIEAIFFDNESIPLYLDQQVFKGIRDFTFHFTAPTFLSPGKIKFKYRLEGFDREQVFLPPGKERTAHYRDLGPGTYTFKVTASNAEGVWNQTGAAITFTLEPFFYRTFFFKIVVILLFAGFLVAAVYIYKKRPFDKRKKYKDSPLNPQFAEVCIQRLNYLVEKEKIYCDAGITLQSLAEKLSIQPYQLSQLLNEKLHQGFSDFINSNRIEEAKKLLASSTGAVGKNTTAAYEVGFNSMTAFYKAFKKFTGMTPNRYKKETR
jgi:ligand-binding sensor domain-containing protein/AraC-like DNA-binding protein